MPQVNVQVPVLMSPAQKRRLARKAKAANLTMGELLRQGGERFSPAEDEAALDQFAKQVTRATQLMRGESQTPLSICEWLRPAHFEAVDPLQEWPESLTARGDGSRPTANAFGLSAG